jgi:hypothetical protein
MFKKIEKLQKMVNNLLGLCAESGADVMLEEYPVTIEDKKNERLGVMLLKLQDGDLEERYQHRMEKWLACDPNALRYYVDFQQLSALLYLHFNPNRFRALMPCEMNATSVN